LMIVLIDFLNIPDLKLQAITKINEILKEVNFKRSKSKRNNYTNSYYKIEEKNNNLAQFGFRIYADLGEYDNAIKFFNKIYYDKNREIKIYVLIRILFEKKKKELIKRELETAINKKVNLREELVKLHKKIIEDDCLPKYFG
ncbi:MAG: hypothetical protein U9N34_10795, partial [Candidatus Cloacimonadota bacterium]|nr:hypothetical protein [Candidatus Cloacimonadota bacterium]